MKVRLYPIIIFILFFAVTARGQSPFMNDGNDRPLYWGSTYIPDGSPYFYDDYKWADVTTVSGNTYKNVRIKFNLLECQLQYLQDDGAEMISTTPVRSIYFMNVATDNGSLSNVLLQSNSGTLNKPGSVTYQMIDSGKVSLLKQIVVSYRDEKRYGEAVTTRHFDRKEAEYIQMKDAEPVKLQKSRVFVTELLKDKKQLINAYIDQHGLTCRSVKDVESIIRFYNNLP